MLRMLWFEITGRCQLECVHCYANSGPHGGHGSMTVADWERVVDEAADLGVGLAQFIGGEPTLHPGLPGLIGRAVDRGLPVEVFTNLVHVPPSLWEVFTRPGVRLATSWYSDTADEHAAITGRRTYDRTMANIVEAVGRSIPLRVGIIGVHNGQRTRQARRMLAALGITEIHVDRLRQVGRGVRDRATAATELCGSCGDGVAAVGPDGSVWPCVFSRWHVGGNVHDAPLAEIVRSPEMAATVQQLHEELPGSPSWPCVPKMCNPQCGPSCSPACNPTGTCRPRGGCVPDYR